MGVADWKIKYGVFFFRKMLFVGVCGGVYLISSEGSFSDDWVGV